MVKNRLQCKSHRRCKFDPWVGKIPWRSAWQPTPVILVWWIPWTEEPLVHGVARVGQDLATKPPPYIFIYIYYFPSIFLRNHYSFPVSMVLRCFCQKSSGQLSKSVSTCGSSVLTLGASWLYYSFFSVCSNVVPFNMYFDLLWINWIFFSITVFLCQLLIRYNSIFILVVVPRFTSCDEYLWLITVYI